MHHLFLQLQSNPAALLRERETLELWCKNNKVTEYDWIEDDLTGKIQRERVVALLAPVAVGDVVVASDIAALGRSLMALLLVMEHLLEHRCTLVTLDNACTMLPNRTMTLFVNYLRDIVEIESRMKMTRSIDIIHAKRTEGVVIGRPHGSKRRVEKTVLFGKEETLRALAASGHSDQEISQQLQVSRATVTNYRKSHGIPSGAKLKKGQ